MKLFVTGGTGFIGAHFINAAHAAGHDVIAATRGVNPSSRVELVRSPVWVSKSLSEITAEDLGGCEVLVHLAAAGITPQPATWEECFEVNVTQTLRLVRLAVSAGVKRVVVSGSYAEYGLSGLRYDLIPPDAPLEPTDIYAASKAAASVALCALSRVLKFELVYYRLFSVFGPGQYKENFWPQLSRAALAGQDFPMTTGEQIRDFISVDRAIAILLRACERVDLKAGTPMVRNLASGKPTSLRGFAEKCWFDLGATGKIIFGAKPSRSGEVMRYVPAVDSDI